MEESNQSKPCCITGRGRGYLMKQLKKHNELNSSANIITPTVLPPKSTYILKQISETGIDSGIHFDKFDEAKVNIGSVLLPTVLPPKSTYIPKQISETDDSIYETGIDSGINFDKFDEAKVNIGCAETLQKIENFDCISIKLKKNIEKYKLKKPTPIQKYTIPTILSGKDLLGAAQTGSGKTVAYVLPILHKLMEKPIKLVINSDHCEPQVVIIAPTRELAVQIHTVVFKLARGTEISSLICYGGTLVEHQKNLILQGCHILVATPGRLNDFLQYDVITFKSLRFLVLDEVDQILDFDSKYEVDRIIDRISMFPHKHRQTIMISATLPDVIQNLAAQYLSTNYVFVSVGIINSASQDITQQFYQVTNGKKRCLLVNMLNKGNKGTMVFVNMKWTADFLATYLSEYGIPAISIHGDRLQKYRELALHDFASGKFKVIVTTAVASRGLDLKCVQQVFNYDMPPEIEEYIHRIGRCGRIGNVGTAISFFNVNSDYHLIEPIIKTLITSRQEIPKWLHYLGESVKDKIEEKDFDRSTDLNTDIRKNVNLGINAIEEW